MLLRRLKKALHWRTDESDHKPLFYHSRISRENPFFRRLCAESGCNHNYVWGVLQTGNLARSLAIKRVSVLEFGVAGGNGLVALEKISGKVADHYGVEIDVYGFDTGIGLPEPHDYRDLPDICSQADFPMEPEKLRQRLKTAKLFLGLVGKTITDFIESGPGLLPLSLSIWISTAPQCKGSRFSKPEKSSCYLEFIVSSTTCLRAVISMERDWLFRTSTPLIPREKFRESTD
jgi:hypothetical protein